MADIGGAVDLLNLKNTPLISVGANFGNIINIVLWAIILAVGGIVIIRFIQHRVFVEILEKVKGGYVVRGGRYAVAYDNKNQLEYLRPMWGSNRLPSFPTECYQKVKGAPFIGIQRELSLVRINKYSYKVSLPRNDDSAQGITKYYDTLSWMFLEQRRLFLKERHKGKLMQILAILAPSFVILGFAVIIGWAIWTQANMDANYAKYLGEMLRIAEAASK